MQVKFGVQVPQEGLTYEIIKRYFNEFENLGFYSAFVYDHFHPIWNPEDAPVLEDWVLLSALARETDKIRIGTLVNCTSFRYPSLLAKMAASVDVISGGRLEFMIGAGWFKAEYEGYGIPFLPPKIRIEQMKEAIQIIKLMWTEHKPCFKGKYYSLGGALNYPKPMQKPYPRIWVGGGGEKLTLKAIAEVGEGTNFTGTPQIFKRKLKILQSHCEKIGRDYNSIKKSWVGNLVIGLNEAEVNREIRKAKIETKKNEVKLEDIEDTTLVGTPPQMISKIEEYLKLGVDYFIILLGSRYFDLRDIEAIKLFSTKVITAFK
ncbi:MAG: LLM class flavin-dependent oxidoreductase [Candidatus Bathyarchaeia archaeon]